MYVVLVSFHCSVFERRKTLLGYVNSECFRALVFVWHINSKELKGKEWVRGYMRKSLLDLYNFVRVDFLTDILSVATITETIGKLFVRYILLGIVGKFFEYRQIAEHEGVDGSLRKVWGILSIFLLKRLFGMRRLSGCSGNFGWPELEFFSNSWEIFLLHLSRYWIILMCPPILEVSLLFHFPGRSRFS